MIKNDNIWYLKWLKNEDEKTIKQNDTCNDNQNDKKKWKYFDLAQSVAASFS